MLEPAWITQQLDRMAAGINAGKTRKRNIASLAQVGCSEAEMRTAVLARGWKLAQVGTDYVVAPGTYVIRPIV